MSGMTLETLENALYAWVKLRTPAEWKAVWADQNAPKPGPKELTIRPGTPYIRKIGRDMAGKVDTLTGARKTLGTRELAFEIRTFGIGATQLAEDIRALLDDDTATDALLAQKLAVVETGPVVSLSPLYGSQLKEVANFELRLRTHSLRESADAETGVGYIETVDLDVTTQHPGGTETEENLVIPEPEE
jgi:hypothetical protein